MDPRRDIVVAQSTQMLAPGTPSPPENELLDPTRKLEILTRIPKNQNSDYKHVGLLDPKIEK